MRSARTTALGTGTERRSLPLYVGVIAADGDTDTPVWIEVLGCGDPNGCTAATAVVAQRAVVRFVRGQTQELPLLLASACVGARCASDQRCATSSGQCEPATRAQEMVRPLVGSVLPIGDDAAVAMDVPTDEKRVADSALDTASDEVVVADVSAEDVGVIADTTLPLDAGSDDGGDPDARAVLADNGIADDIPPIDPPDVGGPEDVPAEGGAPDAALDGAADAPSPADTLDEADAVLTLDVLADAGVDAAGDRVDVFGADDGPASIDAGFDGSTPDVAPDGGVDLGANVVCGAVFTLCVGVCRNLQTDAANCGACGRSCAPGTACLNGACANVCAGGTTFCGGSCVALSSDVRNCGGCGNACAEAQVCTAGLCRVPPLPNDSCGGAQVISFASSSVTLSGSNVGATPSVAAPCGSGVTTDVYFRFTVPGPSRELVYADSVGSSFDTVLYFARDCGSALTDSTTNGDIVCNNDLGNVGCGGGLQSQVVALLSPGTWYLMVGGYGGQTGSIALRVQHLPVGSGGVALLPAGSTTQSGGTSGSGSIGGACGGSGAGESTWWWRTCPEFGGGGFSATTCSRAGWDTLIYLRNAAGGGDACNDDACGLQSTINGSVPRGPGIHAFTVDGYATYTGSFSVAVTRP